jgi:hypothetical protein
MTVAQLLRGIVDYIRTSSLPLREGGFTSPYTFDLSVATTVTAFGVTVRQHQF